MGIVADWQQSNHSKKQVDCPVCHGSGHKSAQDVAKGPIPPPDTCAGFHEARVKMQRSLTEIKEMAAEMRHRAKEKK